MLRWGLFPFDATHICLLRTGRVFQSSIVHGGSTAVCAVAYLECAYSSPRKGFSQSRESGLSFSIQNDTEQTAGFENCLDYISQKCTCSLADDFDGRLHESAHFLDVPERAGATHLADGRPLVADRRLQKACLEFRIGVEPQLICHSTSKYRKHLFHPVFLFA